jgi:hypothetical protein
MAKASVIIDGKKQCGKCRQWKPVDEFYADPRTPTGLTSGCKPCTLESRKQSRHRTHDAGRQRTYTKRYKDKYPERVAASDRNVKLKRKYGVTAEWYDTKFAEQGGVCAACKRPETLRNNLAVDHDHETGEVRGLLCQSCNLTLGLVQESVERLRELIAYLENYQRGIT